MSDFDLYGNPAKYEVEYLNTMSRPSPDIHRPSRSASTGQDHTGFEAAKFSLLGRCGWGDGFSLGPRPRNKLDEQRLSENILGQSAHKLAGALLRIELVQHFHQNGNIEVLRPAPVAPQLTARVEFSAMVRCRTGVAGRTAIVGVRLLLGCTKRLCTRGLAAI